jgi:hypothetical protein
MAVEGGIVTEQVTASLDGLSKQHLASLRAVIVQHPLDAELIDIREAIDDALKAWNDYDTAASARRHGACAACGNALTHRTDCPATRS